MSRILYQNVDNEKGNKEKFETSIMLAFYKQNANLNNSNYFLEH